MTAKEQILATLRASPEPIPVHRFNLGDVSECSISARLRELRREGLVVGFQAKGKPYKTWAIAFQLLG